MVLVLALLLSLPVFASPISKEECGHFDFSSQLGLEPDQGDSWMCHDFVAADMITVFQGIGPQNRVSALDVGSNMAVVDPKDVMKNYPTPQSVSENLEQSRAKDLMDLIQQRLFHWNTDRRPGMPNLDIMAYNLRPNICTERDLPSQASVVNARHEEFLFNKIKDSLGDKPNVFELWRRINAPYVPCPAAFYGEVAADEGRRKLQESDGNLRKSCVHTLPLKPMVAHSVDSSTGNTSQKVLQAFRNGGIAGIGYDSSALRGGNGNPKDPNHVSSVVATRWSPEKNRCEFRLRDSQGKKCADFRKDWPCIKNVVWIPGSDLDQFVSSVFTIDPQK